MAIILGLIIGTLAPEWGHTWITQKFDKVYALKSLPEGSSLLVYEFCNDSTSVNGPVFFTVPQNLRLLSESKTSGKHSCHITLLPNQAIVSDYSSGTLSIFDLDQNGIPNGNIKTLTFPVVEVKGAMIPERQSSSHIHSSWITPDRKYLLVVDLGTDRLYKFSIENGSITEKYTILQLPEGSGPRHLAFTDNKLYIATELSDEVLVYNWPDMKLLQKCCTNKTKPRGGSHIAISPDNKFLYVSSRLKNDGLAIFKIEENGLLSEVGYQNTGLHPRHFSISKDGLKIAVACRDNDLIEIYSRNQESGLLTKESEINNFSNPVFVDFFKNAQ